MNEPDEICMRIFGEAINTLDEEQIQHLHSMLGTMITAIHISNVEETPTSDDDLVITQNDRGFSN